MAIDIFPAASLAFALAVTGGTIYLLWKLWHEQTLEQLSAFANSLPEDEQVIFWRLLEDREIVEHQSIPQSF